MPHTTEAVRDERPAAPPAPVAAPTGSCLGQAAGLALCLVAGAVLVPPLLVGGLLLAAYADARLGERQDEEAKARGNLIVKALGRHQVKEGRFPARLDGLVPRYLDALPEPGRHRQWSYGVGTGEGNRGFVLFFMVCAGGADLNDKPVFIVYDSEVGNWSRRTDPYSTGQE